MRYLFYKRAEARTKIKTKAEIEAKIAAKIETKTETRFDRRINSGLPANSRRPGITEAARSSKAARPPPARFGAG
jgi:hypothetical protein